MTIVRIPTITREQLLKAIEALPPGTAVSFSGLEFLEFEVTQHEPRVVRARFDPNVYRKADGMVVVENAD